jgi:hypothetical protein
MGKKEAASASPPLPRCNIDAPDACSDSEHVLAWACYAMTQASRVWDAGSSSVQTLAYERIESGETELFKRIDSCDADDEQVVLRFRQMNRCRPGNEADVPCLQLLQQCGATPLNAHQMLCVLLPTRNPLPLQITPFSSCNAELPGMNVTVSCEISAGSSVGCRLYVSFAAADAKARPSKKSRFSAPHVAADSTVQPKFNASCSNIDMPAQAWALLSSPCTWNNCGVYCTDGAPASLESLTLPFIHGVDGAQRAPSMPATPTLTLLFTRSRPRFCGHVSAVEQHAFRAAA